MPEPGVQQHQLADRAIHQCPRLALGQILAVAPGRLPGVERARKIAVMQI
jgi:hypothetical protein